MAMLEEEEQQKQERAKAKKKGRTSENSGRKEEIATGKIG